MQGEFSFKRSLGHHCPEFYQLQVPLKTRVIRNGVWSHFETLTCHAEDEYVSWWDYGRDDNRAVPVLACQFSRNGLDDHLMATGDWLGQLVLMDTRKRAKESVLKEFKAHCGGVSELCWNRNGSELITASYDGTLKLWDVNCSCEELSTLQGHQFGVNSVDVHREEPTIIVSGAADGLVVVWDTRCNSKGTHHSPLHVVTHSHCSVTAMHFLGDNGILSSGVVGMTDSNIKVWDKRSLNDPWHVFKTPNERGITAITVDTSHTTMFASCMDSKIYAFDCIRFQETPIAQYSGHEVSSAYIKLTLSPDDRYLLSGSFNNIEPSVSGGYIWEVNNRVEDDVAMSPLVKLPGQNRPVTGVAWCPSQLSKIVTCSYATGTWIWRTSNDSLDEIIGHSEQSSPRVIPTTSPSNHPQKPATAEGKVIVKKSRNPFNRVNKGALSLTPKRMAAIKRTRRVTFNELIARKKRKL